MRQRRCARSRIGRGQASPLSQVGRELDVRLHELRAWGQEEAGGVRCDVLAASVAGFSAFLGRQVMWSVVTDAVLLAQISIAFALSSETYAAPRVPQELREAGVSTGSQRTTRLTRVHGLVARLRKRRRIVTAASHQRGSIAPRALADQCDVSGVEINRV